MVNWDKTNFQTVFRYLRGHSPQISLAQVDAVFARDELESIGKKAKRRSLSLRRRRSLRCVAGSVEPS